MIHFLQRFFLISSDLGIPYLKEIIIFYTQLLLYYDITYLSWVFQAVRGVTVTADKAPPCDDDGDDCRDGARDGVQACPGAIRRCRRARDGGTMPMTRAVVQRCGDRNPSTTPSLEDTDSGRSGFPDVPSFFVFLIFKFHLSKANDHHRI